jgi:molybdopterin molybdotransferase
MITLTEALHTVDGLKLNFETCLMPLFHSIGNFYATDVYATRDFPPFNRSAVDGYAYNTELTHALNQSFKIVATI